MLFSNSTKKLGAVVLGVGILMLVFNLVMVLWSSIFKATSEVTTGYVKDVQVWETHNNTRPRNRSVSHDTYMTI